MEYVRKTVDSTSLYGLFDIPLALRDTKVEVIILPAEVNAGGRAKAKRQLDFIKAPPLPSCFFDPLTEEELQAWGL